MAESRVRMEHWAPGSYVLVAPDGPWVYAFSAGLPVQSVLRAVHDQVTQEWLEYDGPIHPDETKQMSETTVVPEVLWISPPTRELSAKQVTLAQLAELLKKAGYDVQTAHDSSDHAPYPIWIPSKDGDVLVVEAND